MEILLDSAGLSFSFSHIYEHGKFKLINIRGLVDILWSKESDDAVTIAIKQIDPYKRFFVVPTSDDIIIIS